SGASVAIVSADTIKRFMTIGKNVPRCAPVIQRSLVRSAEVPTVVVPSAVMRIAVPRETAPRERRVALVPESCKKLIQAGYDISIEAGAGDAAGFPDEAYLEVAVGIEPDPAALLGLADLVLKVNAPAVGA